MHDMCVQAEGVSNRLVYHLVHSFLFPSARMCRQKPDVARDKALSFQLHVAPRRKQLRRRHLINASAVVWPHNGVSTIHDFRTNLFMLAQQTYQSIQIPRELKNIKC